VTRCSIYAFCKDLVGTWRRIKTVEANYWPNSELYLLASVMSNTCSWFRWLYSTVELIKPFRIQKFNFFKNRVVWFIDSIFACWRISWNVFTPHVHWTVRNRKILTMKKLNLVMVEKNWPEWRIWRKNSSIGKLCSIPDHGPKSKKFFLFFNLY